MRIYLFVLLIVSGSIHAEDRPIYESADDIAIGRIFLTPSERRWLDQRRVQPQAATTQRKDPGAETVTARRPAGYIVRGDGVRRRWQGGEFVNDGESRMTFPGEVRITRHQAPPPESGTDSDQDNAEAD